LKNAVRQWELLDLIVEPDEFKVYRIVGSTRQPLELPKLSFELLLYLMAHAEKICSLEQISAAVWKNTVVTDDTITQRITLLRKALDDDPRQPKYIESVRGRGYRLLASPVACAPAPSVAAATLAPPPAAEPALPSAAETTAATAAPQTTAKRLPGPAIVLLLSLLPLAYFVLQQPAGQSTRAAAPHSGNSVPTLLERANFYANTGQLESTQNAIALYREVLQLDAGNTTALLGLSLALSKSVCRYSQPSARAIEARQLALQALADDEKRGQQHKPAASAAQAAVAYAWDCLGQLEQALTHYMLAAQLDPANYASLGSAAHLLETKGQLVQAYALTQQAKQLQPDNHMADLQISRIFELLKFTASAGRSYQQLFLLYPDNVFINEAYPRFLYTQGRFSEAKTELEKVLTRDVKRYEAYVTYAELVWLLSGKAQALPWFKTAAAVSAGPSYPTTLWQLLNQQLPADEARQRLDAIDALVSGGDRWPVNYIEASLIALWALQDQVLAVEYLQKAVELGYRSSEYLTLSPLFAPLKQQPAFYQLLDRINQNREQQRQQFLALYPAPDL
jgi:DNA-binding winged helix-turn-helix (wHTH) protein/Tfp pilus assembly protein PilF